MSKKLIGTTKHGTKIFAIKENEHMAAHAYVTDEMLAEAVALIDDYVPPFWMKSVDLGHVIGTDNCVEISDTDDVKMLYRKGRKGKTPIVFGKIPKETTLLTIGICRDEDGLDTIFTAFTGVKAPKEPWDTSLKTAGEKAEAERFWATHALVYDKEAIDPKRNPKD